MSRPPWVPTGNEVMRQALIALAIGVGAWLLREQLRKRQAAADQYNQA